MIAEAGLAALWLAAALAVLQVVLAALALRGQAEAIAAVRPVAMVQGGLAVCAMLALIVVFARSDMSVALVATNSHSGRPLLYKIAGAWGNHEGSMLLWVTILGLAGGAVAWWERRLASGTLIAALGMQATIALGFYAFLLFGSNPFARLTTAPADGQGLSPLLQHPGLAFHPPTLYIGYVGLSVAFSFAVGALVTRDVGPAFARAMRPWVLAAWVFLTLGITAGSYWAFYERGQGGWLFWNPVENASLMPWLAATALLHSVTGARRQWARKGARAALTWMTWPLAAAGMSAALLVAGSGMAWLPLAGLSLAAGLVVASVAPVCGRDLRLTPLFTWGAVLAHLGFAVGLAGMAVEASFSVERRVSASVGEPAAIGPYQVTLRGVSPVIGDGWSALQARLDATRGDETSALYPQQRTFAYRPMTAAEPAILTSWNGQLRAVLGEQAADGRWPLRVTWHPFVTLIWFGGVLMALGGGLSLFGRWWHERRAREELTEYARPAGYRR